MLDSAITDDAERLGGRDDLRALQELMSEKLARPVVYKRSVQISQDNDSSRPRKYVNHQFTIEKTGELISVFVKSGMHRRLWRQLEGLHVLLSDLKIPEFRVPLYYGCLNLEHRDAMRIIGVWEYVPNEPSRYRARDWRNAPQKLASAAAAMTALTEQVRRGAPLLRPTATFLHPVAESVDEAIAHYARKGAPMRTLARNVASLARVENAALERLSSLGEGLTHNDYRSANVFLTGEDRPVILDWDTASYGPPGATLRTLARRPEEEMSEWVKIYCDHLEAKGWACAEDDVRFSIRAVEVFHALAFGARISDHPANPGETLIRWGLENLHYLSS